MDKKKNNCCTYEVKIVTFAALGVILVVAGGVLIPVFKKVINDKIKEETPLKNGSQSYDEWHKPTSPIFMRYYVFDLLNKDEVMNGSKPRVLQKGPYTYSSPNSSCPFVPIQIGTIIESYETYREDRRNDPVNVYDNGNHISYLSYKWYYFDPFLSCKTCTPDDEVTTINIPVMTLANMSNGIPEQLRQTFGMVIDAAIKQNHATLFHKLKVREIIWGYNDTLLYELKKALPQFEPIFKKYNISFPDINPFVQLQYNGTNGAKNTGTMTILTGKNDVDKVQETIKWRGKKLLSYWKNSSGAAYGNMINGTDGTHFKPFLKTDDVIYVFIPEICRSLYINYDTKLTVKKIDLLRFTTTEKLFETAAKNPDNKPFCVPKCFKSGLLPIGQCLPMNPPVFMSAPHFYQGDPSLVDDIIGLHPEKKKHATFIDVEPLTGITMQAYKRLQANLLVEAVPIITATSGVRNMTYPIFYIEESAKISDSDAAKFRKRVYDKITMTKGIQYGLIAVGGLFILVAVFIAVCQRDQRRKSEKGSADEKSKLIGGVNSQRELYT